MDAPVLTPATTANATVPVPERVVATAVTGEEEGVAPSAKEEGVISPAPDTTDAPVATPPATTDTTDAPVAAPPAKTTDATVHMPGRVAATAASGGEEGAALSAKEEGVISPGR